MIDPLGGHTVSVAITIFTSAVRPSPLLKMNRYKTDLPCRSYVGWLRGSLKPTVLYKLYVLVFYLSMKLIIICLQTTCFSSGATSYFHLVSIMHSRKFCTPVPLGAGPHKSIMRSIFFLPASAPGSYQQKVKQNSDPPGQSHCYHYWVLVEWNKTQWQFDIWKYECKSDRKLGCTVLHIKDSGLFYWSTRPTTAPAGSDHYFHSECPSVRPKTSKSSDNHCRPGLCSGRVDHWWLLSCILYFFLYIHLLQSSTFS